MKARLFHCLLWGLVVSPTLFAQTTISGVTYGAGQTVTVNAAATITAGPGVSVSSGANVTYQAGTSVRLVPGFTASAGGSFHAFIGSGDGTYTLTVIGGSGGEAGLAPGTVRVITANAPPAGQAFTGWSITSGTGTLASPYAPATTFTLAASNATVTASFGLEADDDGDGVSNTTENLLGLDPGNAADVSVHTFTYDKINQLKRGPGGQYIKDAEGNIKQVTP